MTNYVLGHTDIEVQRLLLQGRIYNDHTEHALRVVGLRPGMRVLDVGCGPGDVSFVASRLVGPTGTTLGVDADTGIIEFARSRAAERGVAGVRFERTAIEDIALEEPVDAVIGRLILVHMPDPVATLRHLAALVRPGGLIAFSESDITSLGSIPGQPLIRAVKDAVVGTFAAIGVDAAFSRRLPALFRQAGLKRPRLTLGQPLGGAEDVDVLACVAEAWRSLYPMAAQVGMVTDELADPETLLPRLREDVAKTDAVVMLPSLVTAWTRV